jgi:hypothetical protein
MDGVGSDERRAALCEVRSIERCLRRFAEEKAEFERSRHALRGEQLAASSSLRAESGSLAGGSPPTGSSETHGETWHRLSAQIAEYESKHAERQRAVSELMMRLEALRPRLV